MALLLINEIVVINMNIQIYFGVEVCVNYPHVCLFDFSGQIVN